MSPSVHIKNVSFGWQDGLPPDLEVDELKIDVGEHTLITGPSGSGKTSLLNLLSGITVAHAGTVEVLGQDLAALSPPRRDAFRAERIGMIFQLFNLVPYLSVLENITLACTFSSARRQGAGDLETEAHNLLNALGLPADIFAYRKVDTLSIGQQQRVAAARALIGRPGLIVADEPTSALDSANRDAFIDLVKSMCADRGVTLIIVSHDEALRNHFENEIHLPDINKALQKRGEDA